MNLPHQGGTIYKLRGKTNGHNLYITHGNGPGVGPAVMGKYLT